MPGMPCEPHPSHQGHVSRQLIAPLPPTGLRSSQPVPQASRPSSLPLTPPLPHPRLAPAPTPAPSSAFPMACPTPAPSSASPMAVEPPQGMVTSTAPATQKCTAAASGNGCCRLWPGGQAASSSASRELLLQGNACSTELLGGVGGERGPHRGHIRGCVEERAVNRRGRESALAWGPDKRSCWGRRGEAAHRGRVRGKVEDNGEVERTEELAACRAAWLH